MLKKSSKRINKRFSSIIHFAASYESKTFPSIIGATNDKEAWEKWQEFQWNVNVCAIKLHTLEDILKILNMKNNGIAKDLLLKNKEI